MTTTPLVIVGAGGHGREVLDIVEAINAAATRGGPQYEVLGFVADSAPICNAFEQRGVPYLGPIEHLATRQCGYVIGIGDGSVRRRIDELVTGWGHVPVSMVHPLATIGSHDSLGPGCVLAAGARITTNVTLGRHVHLNINATISHDGRVGDFVTLAPGATVCGNVSLGDEVYVGAGATIIQGRSVGARTMVGAGAVVVRDLPGGVTAVGVPARPRP